MFNFLVTGRTFNGRHWSTIEHTARVKATTWDAAARRGMHDILAQCKRKRTIEEIKLDIKRLGPILNMDTSATQEDSNGHGNSNNV